MSFGLLELSVGEDGASFGLGMGGMDISIGTTMGALKGLEAWGVNARMALSGQREAWKYAAAMRTLYSGKQVAGKEAELGLFEEILAGRTDVRESSGDFEAETTRENGQRVITLGARSQGLGSGLGLGLGVVLSHEAYRDGYKGSEAQQRSETDTAALSHMHTAMYLEATYGKGSLGGLMSEEAAELRSAYETKNFSKVAGMVGAYDSSEDYWKLKTDGTIVWDGSKDLNVEYYDESGTLRVKKGHVKDTTGSYSQSLALYVGEERASQLMKSNLNNADLYDKQTIMDCLGVSAAEAASIQRSGVIPSIITDTQKQKLVGEALMKASGMAWGDTTGWSGGNSFIPLAMSGVQDIGQIVINKNADGSFDRFVISGVINRDERSYQSVRRQDGVSSYQGLDTMTLYKKDLNGIVVDSLFTSGWQTVANGYATEFAGLTTKKAFDVGDVYRGATIAANNDFSMRICNFSHRNYDGAIFVLNSAQLLNRTSIGLDGGEPWRNLVHSFTNNGVANSSYGMISAGCFINDAQKLNYIQSYMNATWNVNYPYDVNMVVRNGRSRR